MRRAYGLLSWGLIALGVLHMASTWRFFPTLTQSALWFFNGGIVLAFAGALNLINRAHGAAAPSLRWFCRGVNLVMLCFAALAGFVSKASLVELAVVVSLIGAIALFSFLQPALNQPAPRSNSIREVFRKGVDDV